MNNEQLAINNGQLAINNEQLAMSNVKNSRLFAFFFLLFSFFILSGCQNILGPSQQKIPAGMGALSLSVDGARTILPDTKLDSFAYTLDFTGAQTLSVDLKPLRADQSESRNIQSDGNRLHGGKRKARRIGKLDRY